MRNPTPFPSCPSHGFPGPQTSSAGHTSTGGASAMGSAARGSNCGTPQPGLPAPSRHQSELQRQRRLSGRRGRRKCRLAELTVHGSVPPASGNECPSPLPTFPGGLRCGVTRRTAVTGRGWDGDGRWGDACTPHGADDGTGAARFSTGGGRREGHVGRSAGRLHARMDWKRGSRGLLQRLSLGDECRRSDQSPQMTEHLGGGVTRSCGRS